VPRKTVKYANGVQSHPCATVAIANQLEHSRPISGCITHKRLCRNNLHQAILAKYCYIVGGMPPKRKLITGTLGKAHSERAPQTHRSQWLLCVQQTEIFHTLSKAMPIVLYTQWISQNLGIWWVYAGWDVSPEQPFDPCSSPLFFRNCDCLCALPSASL